MRPAILWSRENVVSDLLGDEEAVMIRKSIHRVTLSMVLALAAAVVTHAQWLNYKKPGVPRTTDGKPKLDAPAPKGLDGHPDLTGTWLSVVPWR